MPSVGILGSIGMNGGMMNQNNMMNNKPLMGQQFLPNQQIFQNNNNNPQNNIVTFPQQFPITPPQFQQQIRMGQFPPAYGQIPQYPLMMNDGMPPPPLYPGPFQQPFNNPQILPQENQVNLIPLQQTPSDLFNINYMYSLGNDLDKRQNVCEFLYHKIQDIDPAQAGKITRMFLDLQLDNLVNFLTDDIALNERIKEAQDVLRGSPWK